MVWNDDDGTVDMLLKGGNVNMRVGQSSIHRVYNDSGASIAKGKVVYIYGSQGQRTTVRLADNDTDTTSARTFGFTAEAIDNGQSGFVISEGVLNNISTSGFADGTILWLGDDGNYVGTRPTQPEHGVFLGVVVKGNSVGAGSIFVKIQNGQELDELHDVLITSASAGQVLARNTGNTLWVNKTLAAADVGAAASGSITTSGLTQSTARILGRTTASTGAVEEIQIGSGLSLSAGELSATSSGGISAVGASTADVLSVSGSDLVADDPNADRIVFWDDSESKLRYLEAGSGLTISGTTMTASGGIGGGTGSTDNSILRSDGTGGSTLQASGLSIGDAVIAITGITGDAGTDVITATGSGFANEQRIRFTALTGGSGLNTTTNYFVREVSGDTFKVETSIGGGAVNFTTNITAGTLVNAHAVQTHVQVSNVASDTNSALVLTPKGTGAFIVGPTPDGTATGGNARGANAIDISANRSTADQVASGSSSLIIGQGSRASAQFAIAVGQNINSSGQEGIAAGYNSNSSAFQSCAFGPNSNANTSTGACAVGRNASCSGDNASALGSASTASATNAAAVGAATASLRAQLASRPFSAIYWGGETTTATPLILNLDATATNRFTIAASTALAVDILLVARRSDTQDKWLVARRFLGIRRDGSNNTALIGSVQTLGTDQSAGSPTWTFTLSADDVNECLQCEVQGATGETVQWRATAFYRVV
jgi:hypothetical protein